MIGRIEDLLTREILWKEETPGGTQFYAYVEGHLCQLTMNDYPDEPLYTLKWDDHELDLDDKPCCWQLPPAIY